MNWRWQWWRGGGNRQDVISFAASLDGRRLTIWIGFDGQRRVGGNGRSHELGLVSCNRFASGLAHHLGLLFDRFRFFVLIVKPKRIIVLVVLVILIDDFDYRVRRGLGIANASTSLRFVFTKRGGLSNRFVVAWQQFDGILVVHFDNRMMAMIDERWTTTRRDQIYEDSSTSCGYLRLGLFVDQQCERYGEVLTVAGRRHRDCALLAKFFDGHYVDLTRTTKVFESRGNFLGAELITSTRCELRRLDKRRSASG